MEAEKDSLRNQWMEDKNRLARELEEARIQWENSYLSEQASHERTLQKLRQEHAQYVDRVVVSVSSSMRRIREKEELQLSQQRALEEMRQQCGAERTDWRESTRQELRQEMTREIGKVQNQLESERDEEIRVVVQRFEEEKDELESNLRRRIVQLQHDKEKMMEQTQQKDATLHEQATEISLLHEQMEEQASTHVASARLLW